QALGDILTGHNLTYEVTDNTVLIKEKSPSHQKQKTTATNMAADRQQENITGKVIDDQNNPIPGVSVYGKGTNIGTSTDEQGNYTIQVPESVTTLLFSVIGFNEQEVTINARKQIDITLQSQVDNLDEVVVVGYTTQKVRYLSSSVSNIPESKLKDVTANDLPSMLQGKAPGVVVSTGSGDPSSRAKVLIRGAGTISASTNPLTVVDGNIGGTYNPADVESVSILKDVAATGLYGSRAANGVIIVNTKNGKAGKTVVNFNNSFGVGDATTGNFRLMNSQQLYDY